MFVQRLKDLLREKGVSWKDVSEELVIGKNQLKYWEDRDIAPDGKTLIKLAKHFNVSTDYLLGIDDIKKRLLDMLDTTAPTPDSFTQRLLHYFSKCDDDGKLRTVQFAMNEYDRSEEERKKTAKEAAKSISG